MHCLLKVLDDATQLLPFWNPQSLNAHILASGARTSSNPDTTALTI